MQFLHKGVYPIDRDSASTFAKQVWHAHVPSGAGLFGPTALWGGSPGDGGLILTLFFYGIIIAFCFCTAY